MRVAPITLAWLAGLIDGEGCFGIYYRKRGGVFNPAFALGTKDEHLIREVVKRLTPLTGQLRYGCRTNRGPSEPFYIIQTNKAATLSALTNAVLPYLYLKKPQAGVLRCFLALRKLRRHKGITEASLSKLMYKLNQRERILSHTDDLSVGASTISSPERDGIVSPDA